MTKWHLAGYMCEDGSQDPTIGHQGACSEHGGVITSWDSGNLYADCDEGTIPPEISVADTLALISNAAPSPAYIDCVRS